MGVKKIAQIMKSMCTRAGIGRKLTNHSARKHMVQKLRDSGCCPTDIMQISGHKNVQSIINYSNISLQTQKKCSNILSGTQISSNKSQNTIQNESISISTSSHSQLAAFLNPAQNQLPREPSATSATANPPNPETVAFPTHLDFTRGGLFFGATVNISSLNVYYGEPKAQK
jgi:hypothetical protein